jgi:methylmalonyl-CoA/ethylmalonyl-CoA epimerase
MPDKETKPELPFLKHGIRQIAVIVEDLDKAVEAYWKLLGVGPWHIYTYSKPLVKRMSYRGKPADYKMRLALADVGPLQIELIELGEGETIYAEFVEQHGYGLHHFGVLVDDMEEAIAQAEAAGIAMIQDGAGYGLDGDGGYAYLDTEDKLGTTLELITRPKRRAQPEKIYPPADKA